MLEQHLEKLRSFHTTAAEKSLIRASLRLGITQPAVGKNIRILEALLKTPLFSRHRRGMELTKAGKNLFEFCEALFLRVQDVEARLLGGDAFSGVIRIGTYETLGETFWPRALALLHKRFPRLTIELTTEGPGTVWSKLESGALDAIVDAEPKTNSHYYSKVLYSDHFGLFSAMDSGLAKTREEVLPLSFVQRVYDRFGLTLAHHLQTLGVPYRLLYGVESFTMTRAFVKEDLCIGVLPWSLAKSHGIRPFLWKGKVHRFGEHRICITSLDSRKNEPHIRAIGETLKSQVQKS